MSLATTTRHTAAAAGLRLVGLASRLLSFAVVILAAHAGLALVLTLVAGRPVNLAGGYVGSAVAGALCYGLLHVLLRYAVPALHRLDGRYGA